MIWAIDLLIFTFERKGLYFEPLECNRRKISFAGIPSRHSQLFGWRRANEKQYDEFDLGENSC